MSYLSVLRGEIHLTIGGMDALHAAGVTLNERNSELEMWHEVPLLGKHLGGTGLWHHPVEGTLRPTATENRNYALSAFMALAGKLGVIEKCRLSRTGEEAGDWEEWELLGPGCGAMRHWHSIETPKEKP
jgi:hypothetical protein